VRFGRSLAPKSLVFMATILLKDAHKANHVVHILTRDQIASVIKDAKQAAYVKDEAKNSPDLVVVNHLNAWTAYVVLNNSSLDYAIAEKIRGLGNTLQQKCNASKSSSIGIVNHSVAPSFALYLAEGAALGNYQFLKYLSAAKDKKNSLTTILIQDKKAEAKDYQHLNAVVSGTLLARTLVNEPVMFLTATQFASEMAAAGKKAGFKTTIFNKAKIESLKMGGLLAVNRGSIDPPTFTVMEYKPRNARNKKPIVLVGKGVVFDTGGLSLKPTPGSMDEMKCDMAGGAAVVGAFAAIAAAKLPVYVVGLVPATDNRPGMNALAPQDIITISDGTTVEVLNTDAEGRLILADALVYARRYNPEVCIDLATLTGAAVRAVGVHATAAMGTASEDVMKELNNSGFRTFERIVAFPMWTEYGDEMKSDIADLKNLGGAYAGQISAAKFLEHFTKYPWIHLDIAGTAYSNSSSSYRTKGGSGVGVRLLFDFIKSNYA
jgi:leucyl aminopeptidase